MPVHATDGEGIVADDATLVEGNHVLQAGGLYMFNIERRNTFTTPQGSFAFTGLRTGDPAADYLLGLDTVYAQNNGQPSGVFHYKQTEVYVQDDWKALPRLTMNLGVRWAYFSPDTVDGNAVTSFNPSTFSPTQAAGCKR